MAELGKIIISTTVEISRFYKTDMEGTKCIISTTVEISRFYKTSSHDEHNL